MRVRKRKLAIGLAVALAASAALLPTAARHLRAVLVLLSAVGLDDPTGLTGLVRHRVSDRELQLSVGTRKLRGRVFTPDGVSSPRGVLVLHGVHRRGIDEPRFIAFARGLAAAGLSVLTPELPELRDYRVEPVTVQDIAACAHLHARMLSRPSVGAYGISFGGGLLLLAAVRDPKPFSYLVAVGAHDDLTRLAEYYAGRTVRGPDGTPAHMPAHPYGTRVIIRAHVDELFAEPDRATALEVLGLWLSGQHTRARERARGLSPEGAELMRLVLDDKEQKRVGDRLMQAVKRNAAHLDAVSPHGKLGGLHVPTYLVHGRDDPVIPSIETLWLAREVPPKYLRTVLVTPVLSHMDLSTRPSLGDHWKVVRAVARMLAED